MKTMRGSDPFSKDLFGNPEPGERGYLAPGYSLNAQGEIVDAKGNVYNPDYTLKREALDPDFEKALAMVRAQFQREERVEPEDYIQEVARTVAAQMKGEEKKKQKGKAEEAVVSGRLERIEMRNEHRREQEQ